MEGEMATLQERYVKGLLALGYREEQSRSRKYRLFYKAGATRILLGKSGAVRHTTGSIANSFAAADATKRAILDSAKGE
jgi:hypothetical protein